jgi:hypothetical protein
MALAGTANARREPATTIRAPTADASHAPRKTKAGRSSRRTLRARKVPRDSPRCSELVRETQFAYPPAKKNSAITSPVQVTGHNPGITATTFWSTTLHAVRAGMTLSQ